MTMPSRRRGFAPVILSVCWIAIGVATSALASRAVRSSLLQPALSPVRPSRRATSARRVFERNLDSLAASLARLEVAIDRGHRLEIDCALGDSRLAYKRAESLLWQYSPTVAGQLNGPAEEGEADDAPRPLGGLGGFQQVDDLIRTNTADSRAEARASVARMRGAVVGVRTATRFLDVADSSVLDAARLELARVATVGVAGGDGITSTALAEGGAAVDGIHTEIDSLVIARRSDRSAQLLLLARTLDSAANFLRAAQSFGDFNRLAFIAAYARPAAERIRDLRRAVDSSPPALRRLWRATAATPFERDAFDPWALAPEFALAPTAEVIARGRALFSDPRLSGPGTRACSSCHDPSRAFVDGRTRPLPLTANSAEPLRNTPTLLNAALQPVLFADERAGTLEDQVRIVLTSATEMASSPQRAAARVGMDERSMRVAIAAYLRSLVRMNSRFDLAVRGDTNALTASERRGFTLFMGKARCGTCHFAPLFDGTRPPEFARSELEIIGVPASSAPHHATIDADPGRAGVDSVSFHRNAFRVPSLRNVALTAPYMHNGAYRSLDDVVDFYDRGGGVGIGERLPGQTLPADPLHLTANEKRDLVAFLGALTDTTTNQHDRVAHP